MAQTGGGRQKTLSPSNRESSYLVTLVDDGIVLEENETFSLQLQQISGQQPVAAFQDATVTITDGDGEHHSHHIICLTMSSCSANWCGLLY